MPIPSATRFTRVAPSNRSFAEWREDALIPGRLKMKLGDVGTARGPLGTFRILSPLSTPLLFVARGTGFAPIKAMIEQQLTLAPDREMLLYWGVTDTGDFYDLEELTVWAASDPHFRATLTARHDSLGFRAPVGVRFHMGMAYQALAESELDLGSRDAMSQDRLKRWPRSSKFWLWRSRKPSKEKWCIFMRPGFSRFRIVPSSKAAHAIYSY